jgi:uncharacterized cupin superfamily protein
MGAVRFSPGPRTASHSHALGQALHVTEGLGVVQTRDGQVLTMHPGDTVVSPAGEGHWHGALDRFMTHLVQLFLSVRTVEWHLRQIFTKLDIGSRVHRRLDHARRDGVDPDAARGVLDPAWVAKVAVSRSPSSARWASSSASRS